MRKFLFVAGCLLTFSFTNVMSQENGNRDANNKVVRGPYETNGLFDNIFIGIAGGVNIYQGENDSYGSFGKRFGGALDVNIGKWITPSVGLRLGYSGVKARGWTNLANGLYAKGRDGDLYKESFGVSYLHGDVMWNFSNAVSGYKETRTWDFIPFLGAGWARSYGDNGYRNDAGISIGLLNNIRLCDLLDLTLEARHLFLSQNFDGVVRGSKGEGMTSVTIGLTFKLNRRGFKRVQAPVSVVTDCSQYLSRIQALEGDNKALADENEELRNRKPETVTVSSEVVSASPVVLFFALGKATLDDKELTNLEFYVKHAISVDQNKTFTLIGSADKDTGNATINQKLSEERIDYVYNLLVNKYGISEDRLVKKAEGDTNNRFSEPELNRAVIVE